MPIADEFGQWRTMNSPADDAIRTANFINTVPGATPNPAPSWSEVGTNIVPKLMEQIPDAIKHQASKSASCIRYEIRRGMCLIKT